MTDVIITTLREEAKAYAEANLSHGDPAMRSILQQVYISAYVAGGASVLKKEITDRIADKFLEEESKKKHTKKLKTAYKKAPKI